MRGLLFLGFPLQGQSARQTPEVRAAHLHDVSFLQPTAALVAQLNTLAPTVITTYPSAAVLLADEYSAGRLRCRPREVWTGGETLTEKMRGQIESAFGCPVADSYGLSEFLAGTLLAPSRDVIAQYNLSKGVVFLQSGNSGTGSAFTHAARHSPQINQRSGVSVRLSPVSELFLSFGSAFSLRKPTPLLVCTPRCRPSLAVPEKPGTGMAKLGA